MNKKKILITGSNGMLGSEFVSNNKYNYDFIYTTLNSIKNNHITLDITNVENLRKILEIYNPDVIINCSAYTNVDQAENDKLLVHKINVDGLNNLIKFSNIKTKLVHISSDYVFDGINAPYDEKSKTYPLSYYGKTKLESENILIGSNRKFLIVRPNVLFSEKGNNFFTFVYNNLSNNKKINIVTDQISNPSYVTSLSNAILDLILLNCEGIFHYGTSDSISRYEFALKIAEIFNFDKKLINPIKSIHLNQGAKRPENSTLNCNKIEQALDINMDKIDINLNTIKDIYGK